MDFIEYILFSERKNKFYVRFTSDLAKRITRQNQKSAGFTDVLNDWKIACTENYMSKTLLK